jgi:hypothetical protein
VRAATAAAPRIRQDASALYQSDFTGARSLGRILLGEFHSLAFSQQLEHRTPHGATVEEMLCPTLIANKAEAFIDEETRNRPGLHTYPSD